MRLLIVANPNKANVAAALGDMLPWLSERLQVVGVDTDHATDMANVQADAVLVLGGDGTLLSAARRLHGRAIPLIGVNFGRLGFLASFTPKQFYDHFEEFVGRRLPISSRSTIEASVVPADVQCKLTDCDEVAAKRRFAAPALNDAVITAGPPFHMIELALGADGEAGVKYFGDGVIVSTASGSTAYNVSAGGPIISPNVDAMCITPICPHSLSFRPVVISINSTVVVAANKVNEGTTLFCDGQESTQLHPGDKIVIRKGPHPVLLMENPDAREWRTLAEKLNWAASPLYNEKRK